MLPVAICGIGLVGLLMAEWAGSHRLIWPMKLLAASAYVWAGVSWGATGSVYGLWLLVGLVCCWWGDLLLIPSAGRGWFRAGIVAFLSGHVAYIVAFLRYRVDTFGLITGMVAAGLLATIVYRWVGPRIPGDLRRLVWAYTAVISCMLVAAFGAARGAGPATLALGASMFAISDLSVARDRFISRAFVNRAWGLPLYFGGQLILASTVAQGVT